MTKFWLTGLLLFLSSCSSFLYFPDRNQYVRTERLSYVPEDVYFATADGSQLHAWFIQREDTKRPAKAVIIHFHGNAQNLSSHFLGMEWIRNYGFDYFPFDYRGYGKSQGEPTPQGTVEDGIAAMRYVRQRFPQTPLIIVGQSLGGAVAMRSVIEMKKEIPVKLVVADSTFHSYQEVGRRTLAKSWLLWLLQPLAYVALSDRWAPGDRVPEISPVKLLVVHGTKDTAVGFANGKRLFQIAHEPKEFWEIKDGGHIDFTWRVQEGYRAKLIQEFETALARRDLP